MTRFLPFLLATALHAEFPAPYNTEKGSPMPAEEAAASMQLPEGFKCVVFAAEPDVQQPIALAWDPKGRLWVAECYTYAENPQRWDTKLRDRIIILEDKDNDGKHDGRKVFYDQATYLTSVEVGHGGVWMLAEGGLSFIPDKNKDDVPDGPPELLLDGFNTKTIGHNIVNGLRWGPDGWLYGRHGITDTSAIGAPGTPLDKRTKMNCGLWRYHPTRRVFEVVLHGGTNSWGHDWDANGELFWINTVIGHLFHGIPGSYTDRMFGTHLNSHVYETLPMIADHYHFDIGNEKWSDIRNGVSSKTLELGGGHAHVGMMIYNGGLWPEKYKGRVFTCNLHGNRINVERLDRQGCGFVGKHEPDFMQAKDKWFRGIELSTGPDGNVFVLDWSDSGECHDNDGVHRTSGRIYKIVYGEGQWAGPLVDWTERMEWSNRSDKTYAVKVASEGLARLHEASALQKLPLADRWPIATALAQREEDARDRDQPLMIWYGIEPAVAADPAKGIELVSKAKIPTVRRLVTRRIVEDYEKNGAHIEALVVLATKSDEARTDILQGMAAALKGVASAPKPKGWDELVVRASARSGTSERAEARTTNPEITELSLVFGSGRAIDDLIAIIEKIENDANARSSAFASLMKNPKPEHFQLVRKQINDKVLGGAARLAMARFPNEDVPKALLNNWPERSIEWRAANITTLTSRAAWTKPLLDAMAAGMVSRADLSPFQARQIRALGDEALNKQLTTVWGELRDTPEAKKAELVTWKKLLTTAGGDATKGKLIFTAACGACHKMFGEGGKIGPDLTGSDRKNLDYLLGNIVDPNALVPADFRVSVFKLKDGRTVTGVIPEQTEKVITIQTPVEKLTVERTQISEQKQLAQSLMPEGLLTALGEENVKHLIAFLMK
ncbi:MAG: c-type cytochrome [Verrucomicrobiaceae bacterium]|nr:c-type cytochrome [Verrucomicrobiaceae bacterium]